MKKYTFYLDDEQIINLLLCLKIANLILNEYETDSKTLKMNMKELEFIFTECIQENNIRK